MPGLSVIGRVLENDRGGSGGYGGQGKGDVLPCPAARIPAGRYRNGRNSPVDGNDHRVGGGPSQPVVGHSTERIGGFPIRIGSQDRGKDGSGSFGCGGGGLEGRHILPRAVAGPDLIAFDAAQAGGAAHSDGDGRIRPLSRRIAAEGEGGDIRRFAVDSESLEGDGCRFVARLVGGGDDKGAYELRIDAEGGRRRSRPAVRKSVGKFPDTAERILGGERDCDCLPEKQAERDRVEKLEKPVGSVACPDAGRGLRIQVIIDRDRLGDGAVRLLQIQGRGLVFSG